MAEQKSQELALSQAKEQFVLACKEANQLQIVDNFGSAFSASVVIIKLREALTDEVMSQVFMPLMNTKIGFRTDKDPKKIDKKTGKPNVPYTIDVVRDCIIDAVCRGLQPTGNQFNIIAENMFPTKEGYQHLLTKYIKNWAPYVGGIIKEEKTERGVFVTIPTYISYNLITDKDDAQKRELKYNVQLPMPAYASLDQIKGKAEARLYRQLHTNVSGIDLGISDGEHVVEDGEATIVETHIAQNANQQNLNIDGNDGSEGTAASQAGAQPVACDPNANPPFMN